jgi:Cu+-exporting ATPase
MVHDPVCGMEIEVSDAPATAKFGGETYYFCSDDCYQEFMDSPEEFVEEGASPDAR